MRIIVIDDDPQIRAMIDACTAASDALDCAFDYASSDQTALALLHAETRFDIALVSIDGGAVSGLSIFRRLLERSLRMPRVALTYGHDVGRIKAAIVDGAADILVKPLDPDDVARTLARVIERVERRRRNWGEHAAYMALRREVDIAADMQRRILPQSMPERAAFEADTIMRPARGIGGDFYDIFAIDENHLGLTIADVSGKGVPAAFYMAVASTAMRSVGLSALPPGECLSEVNESLVGRDIPGMFVSAFYAVINTADWTVRCANAGHSPPLLCASATAAPTQFVSEGGPVMGIIAGERYAESRFELAPGTSLLLYTDGVTEAYDRHRQQFGDQRLAAVVATNSGASSSAQIAALEHALDAFTEGADQHDDITAFALRRVP